MDEVFEFINRLKDKEMLVSESNSPRKYRIRFDNNFLLRGIIKHLGEKGFLTLKD